MNRLDRTLIRLSQHTPVHGRASSTSRVLAGHAPNVLLRAAVKNLPAGESKAVTERGSWLPTLLGEGATNSRGGVDEYLAMRAPWGFAPEDLTVPVHVFRARRRPRARGLGTLAGGSHPGGDHHLLSRRGALHRAHPAP